MTVQPEDTRIDERQGMAGYDDVLPVRKGMPVTIVEDDTMPDLAVVASFSSRLLAGNEPPYRLLAQDRRRKKATINIHADPAAVGTQSVVLSRQGQVSNAQGARFFDEINLTYEAESELWVQPQAVNGQVWVTVIEERRTPRD